MREPMTTCWSSRSSTEANPGLPVVAKGVDSEDTLNALISLGCDVVHGYHFAPPLPPDQLRRRVR